MKKVLCISYVAIMVLSLCMSASAHEEEFLYLSEMSDEELLSFLAENGLEIPVQFETEAEGLCFVRHIITVLEANIDAPLGFGYFYLQKFADQLQAAITNYYSDLLVSTYAREDSENNILQDNTVVGVWNDSYYGYNCYAYAIGRTEWTEPGDVLSGKTYDGPTLDSLDDPRTLAELADAAIADLEYMGYSVAEKTTICPNISVTEHERLICIRVSYPPYRDFHFMVLEEDGYWYHKPGTTNPLRYNSQPSSSIGWVYEAYQNGIYTRNDDWVYTGLIYYINYTIPCICEFTYIGNNMHAPICTVCEKIHDSTPCSYDFTYIGNGMHIRTCTECGQTKGIASHCLYVNGLCRTCGSHEPIIQQSLTNASISE